MGRLVPYGCLVVGLAWGLASVQAQESLTADIVSRTKSAVVYVKSGKGATQQSGSGFVIRVTDDTALVATNQHVVTQRGARPRSNLNPRPGASGFSHRPPRDEWHGPGRLP